MPKKPNPYDRIASLEATILAYEGYKRESDRKLAASQKRELARDVEMIQAGYLPLRSLSVNSTLSVSGECGGISRTILSAEIIDWDGGRVAALSEYMIKHGGTR